MATGTTQERSTGQQLLYKDWCDAASSVHQLLSPNYYPIIYKENKRELFEPCFLAFHLIMQEKRCKTFLLLYVILGFE
jgi:hypothetical protein